MTFAVFPVLAVAGTLSFHVTELFPPELGEKPVCSVEVPDGRQRIGEGKKWGFGAGLKSEKPVPVAVGGSYEFTFSGRVPNLDSTYILYLKMFDAGGHDVTSDVAAPPGWAYSPSSKSFYQMAIRLDAPNAWQEVKRTFVVPDGVSAVRPVVAAWRGDWVECRSWSLVETKRLRWHELKLVRESVAADGTETLADANAQLALTVSRRDLPDGLTRIRATIADRAVPPRPRALKVSLDWAADLDGWTWHRAWRTDVPVGGTAVLRDDYGVAGHAVARYPFSAVSKDGVGFALGVPLDGQAYEGRSVTAKGIVSTVPVGLLERGGKGTSATFEWMVFPFRGTWGFRSAAKAYYALEAHKIPSAPKGAREGTWQWPTRATQLPDHPDDFGLAFWEAPTSVERMPKEISRSHALGIGVYPYTEAWGMRQPLRTLPDGGHPSVDERLAELRSWAAETNATVRWFDAPRNVAAQAALNSLPVQTDGTHPFVVDKYDSWTHWWRTNADPRLAKPNRASLCWDYTVGVNPDLVDGLYLDSVSYGFSVGFNNTRPEHLAVMDEPLVYDVDTARPCANGMQHQVAFVKWVADMMHARGKRIFGNVFEVAHRFHATTIDIFGSEVGGWGAGGAARADKLRNVLADDECCERRFYAYHRPVGDLLQEGNFSKPAVELPAAGITNYVEHHLFYGFYPGVCTIGGEEKPGYANWKRYFGPARQCERDRELFRRVIPLFRQLNRAGWEPETLVRCADSKVLVERYGSPAGLCFLTVRNASDQTRDVTLVPDGEFAAQTKALKALWHGADVPRLAATGWRARLEPWQTVVYQVEER